MSVRSAQSITVVFTTHQFDTGAATNADSTPTGTLYVNGTADAAAVTVTNITTGVYKAAVTLPTLAVGDVVDLRIAATVNSVSANGVIWRDTKDVLLDSSGKTTDAVQTGDSYSYLASNLGANGANATEAGGDGDHLTAITGGTLSANVVQISGDSTAADNLELQYDGTGLTGDTYPATQAQAGNIAVAGAAINTVAESDNQTTGTQTSGTFASTQALDGTTHQFTDSAGTLEIYYQFDLGADGIPTSTKLVGRVTGANDNLGVYAYNWAGTSWDQVGTLVGTNGSANETDTYDLLTSHVGTGSFAGKVRIRFYAASGLTSATLYVDQLLVSYTQSQTGIPNGSTITLSSSTTNTNLIGRGWTLALGGQDITGSYIFQSTNVSGTATGTNGSPYIFQECSFGTTSLGAYGFIENSAIGGTLTLTSTGGVSADSINLFGCYSGVAGAGAPTITASGVTKTTNIQTRGWHGGLTAVMNSDCVWSHEVVRGGTQTFTNAGGQLELRGDPKAVSLTTSGSATSNLVIGNECPITIAGTGGTVNLYGILGPITNTSTGVTINILSGEYLFAGTASGTPSTTVFDIAQTVTASKYIDCLLMFTDGNAADEPRSILSNTTGQITVSEAFTTAPASGDNFLIYRDHIHPVSQIQSGLATSAEISALNDLAATDILSDGVALNTSSGVLDTVTTVGTVSALAADSVNASALASDATAEIGTAFLTTTLTKGTAGTIERAFWQILKAQATVDGVVAGTPTSSAFDTDLTAADGTYDHQLILFTSGSLAGEARPIDTYVQTNGRFTLQEALTAAPSATDEFVILPDHVHPVADIQSGLATSAEIAALNDLAATDILSDGVALNTTSGVLDVVNLVNTTTTNTDMRGTDSAFLAASAPTNFSSLVISGAGAVDSLVQGFLNNTIAETTADNIAANFETFFDNADAITASVIDDVGSGGGGDASAANQTTIITHLTDIKGTGFVKDTHSLVNIEGYVDVIDDGTSGLVKIASDVAAILVDTNELQTDWTNGGRLDTLLDTAAGSGAGSGARTVTITVDDGTDPLQNAIVRMTEGVNTYKSTSNASGIAVFNLDDATYTVAISKSGYTYAGTSLVVDGDETATYSMSAIVFSAPDNADMTLGYFTVYDITGAALASETITYKQTTNVSGYGTSFEPDSSTLTSDANGLVQVNLYKGANYAFTRTGSKAFTVTIPDDAGDSYELPNML